MTAVRPLAALAFATWLDLGHSVSLTLAATPANLTWDASPLTAGPQDGGGTWDLSATNFYAASTGLNYKFDNSPAHDVYFGSANGPAGVVTLTAAASVHALFFNPASSDTYTMAGNAPLTMTTSSSNSGGPRWVTNVDAVIAAPVGSDSVIPARISKQGVGRLILTGTNTFGAGADVAAGTLQFKSPAAMPGYDINARYSVSRDAVIAFNIGGIGEFTSANIYNLIPRLTSSGDGYVGLDTSSGSTTYTYPQIYNLGIAKLGSNTLTCTGAAYSGPAKVLGGTLKFTTNNNAPTGLTTVASGATLEIDSTSTTGSGIAVPTLQLAGQGSADARGALFFNSGGTSLYHLGDITLNGPARIGSFGVNHSLYVSGIYGQGDLTFDVEGTNRATDQFNANFGASSSYSGNTTLTSGNANQATYTLLTSSVFPETTVMTLMPGAGALKLDLGTQLQRVAGLRSSGSAGNAAVTGGSRSKLFLNTAAGTDFSFGGAITGQVAVQKEGAGTQRLMGKVDTAGLTTVSAGTLVLGKEAFPSVLTNGGR